MPTSDVPSLAEATRSLFARLNRPYTGELFLAEYADMHAEAAEFLAKPYPESVTAQAVFNLMGRLPMGRIIGPADVGLMANAAQCSRPPLSDGLAHWLLLYRRDTARLIGGLLGRLVLFGVVPDGAATLGEEMATRTAQTGHRLSFDYGGLVRVATLLSAEGGEGTVTARSASKAAILLLDAGSWALLREALADFPNAWSTLELHYRRLREQLTADDPLAHDRLLSVGLFSRDDLVPLPASMKIRDLRLPGRALAFAWPGQRGAPDAGPLDSAPSVVDETALLSHVLVPGLIHHGLRFVWSAAKAAHGPLLDATGQTGIAGWHRVLTPLVQAHGLADALADAGYRAEEVVAWACGLGNGERPTSREVIATEEPQGREVFGSVPTPPHAQQADSVAPTAGARTFRGIAAALEGQGFNEHRAVIEELALLADPRADLLGPRRVLLLGPTGCGKTSLLAALADHCGRPFVRVDASSIVEHGWQGTSVADIAAELYRAAGEDLQQAEAGVVLLDEFCKVAARVHLPWAERGEQQLGVWAAVKAGRQAALLPLLDTGPSVISFPPKAGETPLKLRTGKLLVVAAGAFTGLTYSEIAPPSDDALTNYGVLPELVGRLTTRLCMSAPTGEAMSERLKRAPGGVDSVVVLARTFGVELRVSEEAMRLVRDATVRGDGGLSPRTGAGVLAMAARRALRHALRWRTEGDHSCVVGPDDVIDLLTPYRTRT